jgi:tRNA threonylcarbamoyladenosine biosynthesis protein TsaE
MSQIKTSLFRSASVLDTDNIARTISPHLVGGDVVLLSGELGAGKTTLSKAVAKAIGVKSDVTSPTFTLMNVYDVPNHTQNINQLVHIDTYRLKNEQELLDIGAVDYIGASGTITIIEWPEHIKKTLSSLSPHGRSIHISIALLGKQEREYIMKGLDVHDAKNDTATTKSAP